MQEPLSSAGSKVPLPDLSVTKGFFCAGLLRLCFGEVVWSAGISTFAVAPGFNEDA